MAPKTVPYQNISYGTTDGGDTPPKSPVVENEASIPLAEVSDEELVTACKARLCPFCPEKADADGVRLRSLAEMDNTRKRLAREKEEHSRYATDAVLADILPAIDNFDLALAHAPTDPSCKNFVIGVDMTRKLLLEALQRHGLIQVGMLGETFDPAIHEAVGTEPNPEYGAGQVCALMSKGYRLKDRLLRPAKVVVCQFEQS